MNARAGRARTPSPAAAAAPPRTPGQTRALRWAGIGWIAFIFAAIAVEWLIAPVRPNGSWLVLKAVPLALLAPGVLRGNAATLQWALMLSMVYALMALARLAEGTPAALGGALETVCIVVFFVAALIYLRPLKRAAKAAKAARLIDD